MTPEIGSMWIAYEGTALPFRVLELNDAGDRVLVRSFHGAKFEVSRVNFTHGYFTECE